MKKLLYNLRSMDISWYFIGLLLAFGFFIKLIVSSYPSGDYQLFLKPWMQDIVSNGRILSLGVSIGNYTPPYVYLLTLLSYFSSSDLSDPFLFGIKLISILFDLFLAFSVYLNAKLLFKKQSHLLASMVGLIVFFLPTVIFNSAYWGQIDASYTAFGLIGLYFLQREKPLQAMLWFAVALTFKLQAIFLMPVFIIYFWFHYRQKLYYFLWIPVVYVLFALPTVLFGRDWMEVLTIYSQQITTYQSLTLNMPNMWMWFGDHYDELYMIGILFFTGIMGIGFLSLNIFKIKPSSRYILLIALLSIMTANFFLPAMHERYLYSADVISVLVAIQFTSLFYVPIVLQVISTLAYMPFLFNFSVIPLRDISFLFLGLLILLYRFGVKKLISENVNRLS
jgi:Gpi18-like mannosyltransferase